MVKKTEVWRRSIPYVQDKIESFILPKLPITKITIVGSGTTVNCTSTATAHINLHGLQMKIDNRLFLNVQGDQDADEAAFHLTLLEEFYKQKHHVAHPDSHWVIEFPSPLPINANIELILLMASAAQNGCVSSDAQPYIASYDITLEYEDGFKGTHIVPFITSDKFDTAALTDHLYKYIPPMPKPLRAVIMVTETGDAISASAYDRLTVKTPTKIYFDGSMAELEAEQEGRSKYALTTGYYIVQFPGGIKVEANTLLFDFYNAAASNEDVHFLYICY